MSCVCVCVCACMYLLFSHGNRCEECQSDLGVSDEIKVTFVGNDIIDDSGVTHWGENYREHVCAWFPVLSLE